jgi:hypothetical protein
MEIFKDRSKKHLILALVLSISASIFGYFIIFYPFSVLLSTFPPFTLYILFVGLIFLNSLFWAGFSLSITISLVIKKLFHGIFELNNWTYTPSKSLKNISLIIPLSLYLIVFWTYFRVLGKDNVSTLLLGWLCLIIIRAAHYADPKDVGDQIGKVIGAFVLPFWLVTFCYYFLQFLTNNPIRYLANNLLANQTFIILLLISFCLEIIQYRKKKNEENENMQSSKKTLEFLKENMGYLLYPIILIISFILFYVLPNNFSIQDYQYILSSLIQSQAAIIGIVITLSLIAIQIAASRYSMKMISIFMKSFDFWFLSLVYIGTLLFNLYILQWKDIFQNDFHLLLKISYISAFFCFSLLIPYTWNILKLTTPDSLIKNFCRRISKKSLFDENDDPIQPIRRIIKDAIDDSDYPQTIKGLDLLTKSIKKIIDNEFTGNGDSIGHETTSIEKVYWNIEKIADQAFNAKSQGSLLKAIESIEKIGLSATNEKISIGDLAVNRIVSIGRLVSNESLFGRDKSIFALHEIGKDSVRKNIPALTRASIEGLNNIGSYITDLRVVQNQIIWAMEDIRNDAQVKNQPIWIAVTTEINESIQRLRNR